MHLSKNGTFHSFQLTFPDFPSYNKYSGSNRPLQKGSVVMSKVDENKQQKRESLLDSAFQLFIEHGFSKTSISDIVHNAGVAKGTFYLYFKDKLDIRNHLIAHEASQVFKNACTAMEKARVSDFEDQVIFIIDHILDQFSANVNLVLLLSKHLSWGFLKNSVFQAPGEDTPAILTIFQMLLEKARYQYKEPEVMMYLILELISGSSYNAILYKQPVPLSELKPYLYQTVRTILQQHRAA